MKIYTKTGDKGTTCLIGGTRVSKASVQLEAYGTSDELNSFIGWLRAAELGSDIDGILARVQNKLFNLGAYLALDEKTEPTDATSIKEEDVRFLETAIDDIENTLPKVFAFIIPGGSERISRCHICRTICRRLERRMVELFELTHNETEQARLTLQFVNRLSDFLFILSKKVAQNEKKDLFLWEK